MQNYANLLASVAHWLPAVVLILGSVVPLVTALGGVCKGVVAAFPVLKDGRLDHLGNLFLAAGVDLGKAKDALGKVVGPAPLVKP